LVAAVVDAQGFAAQLVFAAAELAFFVASDKTIN
jgi:hypothetical protein